MVVARLLKDSPRSCRRVLGHSVEIAPLVVLVSVTTVGLVLGGFAVILRIPLASIYVVTLIDIVIRDRDPQRNGDRVVFPAKDLRVTRRARRAGYRGVRTSS